MGVTHVYCLELPYPPSVNHYWRHVGNKVLISKEGRDYRKRIEAKLFAERIERIERPVELGIKLIMPDRRRRDIDNVLKALLDGIQHGGLIKNDEQVFKLTIEKGGVVKGGMVVMEIVEKE